MNPFGRRTSRNSWYNGPPTESTIESESEMERVKFRPDIGRSNVISPVQMNRHTGQICLRHFDLEYSHYHNVEHHTVSLNHAAGETIAFNLLKEYDLLFHSYEVITHICAHIQIRAKELTVHHSSVATSTIAFCAFWLLSTIRSFVAEMIFRRCIIAACIPTCCFFVQIDLIVNIALQKVDYLFIRSNGKPIWVASPYISFRVVQ